MKDKEILEKLFNKRDHDYSTTTNVLFGEVENCLYAIELLFEGIMTNFIWNDIEYDIVNNIIMIMANAKHIHPTLNVKTKAGNIQVSTIDENGNSIRKEIYVGIPLELALTSNHRDIYMYLVDMELKKGLPIFSIENLSNDIVNFDNDSIFNEIYIEMQKNKTRILH